MIWDDPWVLLAMQGGTTIPPPRTPLAGQRFVCVQVRDLDLVAWIDLVGTRWTPEEVAARLVGAWIPCLFADGDLVATCVLRPLPDKWILETLRARKGYGTPLLRAVIPWLYAKAGPFTLGYTWELSAPGLCGAWLKGWLGSATTIQYGWAWSADCSFCPTGWSPIGERLVLPTLFQSDAGLAIVSDSGLGDGWGNVLAYRGSPSWDAIAKKGGWKALWMRASRPPYRPPYRDAEWIWTGEFVVVGLLNYRGESPPDIEWITAEI